MTPIVWRYCRGSRGAVGNAQRRASETAQLLRRRYPDLEVVVRRWSMPNAASSLKKLKRSCAGSRRSFAGRHGARAMIASDAALLQPQVRRR